MATKQGNDRLAVLIDADQGQQGIMQELISEISRYGAPTIKRAYGDWTTQDMAPWKSVLQASAIQPVQQFRYTKGKNATDSALIIDAMDVLHSGVVDGFCLVSSDSDFTRLATRIREAGLAVYGFGERKTPEPFVAACDKFIYTEILKQKPVESAETAAVPVVVSAKELTKLQPMVIAAIDANAREDGWAPLGGVGGHIGKVHPSFDSRNYGFKKLSDLVRTLNYVEVKDIPVTRPDGVVLNNPQIRMKRVAH